MFFDAHNHLSNISDLPRTECLGMCTCCIQEADWKTIQCLQLDIPLRKAIGVHPWVANKTLPGWEIRLEKMIEENDQFWIGECGFDTHKSVDLEFQKHVFQKQWELSQKYHRSLIVHCVKAWEILYPFIRRNQQPFLMHRFQGTQEQCQKVIECGGIISIHPHALRSAKFRETLRAIGSLPFIVESDAMQCQDLLSVQTFIPRLAMLWNKDIETLKLDLWGRSRSWFFPFTTTKTSQ